MKKHNMVSKQTWIKRLIDACNVHKRCGYIPWVLGKPGSFILIEWETKKKLRIGYFTLWLKSI